MRLRPTALLTTLLLAACSASGAPEGSSLPVTTATTALATTTAVPTTTAAPAATTTTTTTLVPSVIVQPPQEDLARYQLLASADKGRFGQDAMGGDAWAAMLRDGAVEACIALAADGSSEQAIRSALARTPLAGVPIEDYQGDEFSLASTLVLVGAPIYCPGVTSELTTGSTDAQNQRFLDAWQSYVGE